MISDTPGRGGEGGGQKRANFCGRPLWMAPRPAHEFSELTISENRVRSNICSYNAHNVAG